jgi:hypothetical protein
MNKSKLFATYTLQESKLSNSQPEMPELHSWPVHLTADLRQKLLDDKLRRAQEYWSAQQKSAVPNIHNDHGNHN